MRKLILFVAAAICSIAMSAKTVYLNSGGPDLWDKDGAVLFVHSWGDHDVDAQMEHIMGGLYKADIDVNDNLCFVRMPAGYTSIVWGEQMDQTDDFMVSSTANFYTITDWGYSYGFWSEWVEPTCYYTAKLGSGYGWGWYDGYLEIEDNGVSSRMEMMVNTYEQTCYVYGFGGTPVVKWHSGTEDEIVSYVFYDVNGLRIGGHNSGDESFDDITLDGPCEVRENPYKVTGLQVTEQEGHKYRIDWDALTDVDNWFVKFTKNGKNWGAVWCSENYYTLDLSDQYINAEYTIEVIPYDTEYYPLGLGSKTSISLVLPNVGAVTLRALIPSDCSWDIELPVTFNIFNSDWDVVNTLPATREGTSRWWRVETTIDMPSYYFDVNAEDGGTVKYYSYSSSLTPASESCMELTILMDEYTYDGVIYREYDGMMVECDAKDHNYTIASATLTGGEGKLSVKITPEQDIPYRYCLYLYTGSGDSWGAYYINGTEAEYNIETGEDIVFTSWYIQPLDENWNYIANPYNSTEEVTVKAQPGVGEVTLNVLIPSDNCFNTTNGVWFYVEAGSYAQCVKADELGGRWFTKKINVTWPTFRFLVADRNVLMEGWEGAQSTNSRYDLKETEYYFSMRNSYYDGEWSLYDADSGMKDHNYKLTDATVAINDETGDFTFEITAAEIAPCYYIYMYKEGESDYDRYYEIYPEDEELAGTKISRTYRSTFPMDTKFDRIIVRAYARDTHNETNYRVCEYYESTTPFIIPASKLLPKNLDAKDNGNNSYTLSWDANDEVCKYYVYAYYEGSNIDSWSIYKSYDEPVDGRYSVLLEYMIDNGKYSFEVEAYDCDNQYVGYAWYDFEVTSLKHLGDVKVRVHLSPVSTMPLNAPVTCSVVSTDNKWFTEALTYHSETGWWEATVNVDAPVYEYIQVLSNDETPHVIHRASLWTTATETEICAEIGAYKYDGIDGDDTYKEYKLSLLDCSEPLKDYTIASATVTPGEGKVTVSVTPAADQADGYKFITYTGEKEYYGATSFYAGLEATVTFNNNEALVFTSWELIPVNQYATPIGATYVKDESFTVLPDPCHITGITATAAGNNQYKIAWDVNEHVYYYDISIYDATGTNIYNTGSNASMLTQEGGKYVITSPAFAVEGLSTVKIWACDENWNYSGYAAKTFLVENLDNMGDATVRVLIPTDNNMDISDGVWFWWWKVGDSGNLIKAEAKEGRWFEATFSPNAPGYQFLVVNRDVINHSDKWVGAQQSYDSPIINSEQYCVELSYRDEESSETKWWLYSNGCEAVDHDYRATFKVDAQPGLLSVTVEAKDYTPIYYVGYRLAGSGDGYDYYRFNYNGENVFTLSMSNPSDMEIEYVIEPAVSSGGLAAARQYGTITIPANNNMPTLQTPVVAPNGQDVTFSWIPGSGTDVAYYKVWVYESYYSIYTAETKETSATITIYIPNTYSWSVGAYDADNNFLGQVYGPDFTTTGPDLKPTNLKVAVNENVATFTWNTPDGVDFCWFNIYDDTDDKDVVYEKLTGTDGAYSYTYTIDEAINKHNFWWNVRSGKMVDATEVSVSDWVYGDEFNAQSEGPEPTMFTLTLSTSTGGTVNSEKNGQYAEGTKVTIIATPDEGYTFDRWSDNVGGATRELTMDKDYTLTAYFAAEASNYTLTVTSAGGGTVSATQSGSLPAGTEVTLTAIPETNWDFDHWSDGNKDNPRTITMDKNYNLVAYFTTTETFTVSITAGKHGSIEPKEYKDEVVTGGTVITVEAVADDDYTFTEWSDGVTKAKREIVITQDTDLVASFEKIMYYDLVVEITPKEGGKVFFDGKEVKHNTVTVEEGTVVELTVEEAAGYQFEYYLNGKEKITKRTYKVTVDDDITIKAVFQEAEGIENVEGTTSVTKVMRDGTLYILRNGHTYSTMGARVQ